MTLGLLKKKVKLKKIKVNFYPPVKILAASDFTLASKVSNRNATYSPCWPGSADWLVQSSAVMSSGLLPEYWCPVRCFGVPLVCTLPTSQSENKTSKQMISSHNLFTIKSTVIKNKIKKNAVSRRRTSSRCWPSRRPPLSALDPGWTDEMKIPLSLPPTRVMSFRRLSPSNDSSWTGFAVALILEKDDKDGRNGLHTNLQEHKCASAWSCLYFLVM